MSIHYMHDNHTFTRLDALPVEEAMRRVRISTERDHGFGFVGGTEPHGDETIAWRAGDDWEPRVRALLERAAMSATEPKP